MGFTGSLNGTASVTVNGAAGTVNSGHYFSGTASLTPGSTSTVSVVATDASGNSRTNLYQTTVPAELSYNPVFDADGNELSNLYLGCSEQPTKENKNVVKSNNEWNSFRAYICRHHYGDNLHRAVLVILFYTCDPTDTDP